MSDINWRELDLGVVSAFGVAKENGWTGTEAEWEALQAAAPQAGSDAEAYAAGTRSGEEVESDDPAYENNANYYAGQAAGSATAAAGSATAAAGYATDAETAKVYAQTFTGAPRTAATAEGMTDHDLIYVFTGTTTASLTNGHWYYWDGEAWADGGAYNSTALTTDTTLLVSGAAADSKAVGDKLNEQKSAFNASANNNSSEGSISGLAELKLNLTTGYWGNSSGIITANSTNTKYKRTVIPLNGVSILIHCDVDYAIRVIHAHSGGGGSYNLTFDSQRDEKPTSPSVIPRDVIIKSSTYDDYILINFYHVGESADITDAEIAEHYTINSVSVNAINEIVNSKKPVPDGFVQIPVKIEPGVYYNSSGTMVANPRYFVTTMFPCDEYIKLSIRLKYYVTDNFVFNFYDESGTHLIQITEGYKTTDPIQYIEAIVPKGAKYARCFSYVYNWDTFAVYGQPVKYTEFAITNITDNAYIEYDTGAVHTGYNSAIATDYIDIEGYDEVILFSNNDSYTYFAFYDKDKQYVNGDRYKSSADGVGMVYYAKIPALVKYIRTSIYKSNDGAALSFVRAIPVENTDNPYYGKYFSILGDSISTFNGFIPSGNAYWYPHGDVTRVTDLWWSKLLDHFHGKLLIDEAWSGSQISGTAASAANNDSRCKNLGTESKDPDVIIVYMGTNDYDHNIALGTYDGHDTIPSTVTTFSDAYAVTLDKILTKYKHAEVWCCTLQPMERHGQTGFPEKNNLGLTPEDYNEVIRKIAHAMNCKILEHSQCGITYYNMPEYFEDWSGSKEHPNKAGHTLIARHDIRFML